MGANLGATGGRHWNHQDDSGRPCGSTDQFFDIDSKFGNRQVNRFWLDWLFSRIWLSLEKGVQGCPPNYSRFSSC